MPKPDYLDRSNGYRYYKKEKILEYYKITYLKDVGFTLKEIQGDFINLPGPKVLSLLQQKKEEHLLASRQCQTLIEKFEEVITMNAEYQKATYKIEENVNNQELTISGADIAVTLKGAPDTIYPMKAMMDSLLNQDAIVNVFLEDVRTVIANKALNYYEIVLSEMELTTDLSQTFSALNASNGLVLLYSLPQNATLEIIHRINEQLLYNTKEDIPIIFGAEIMDTPNEIKISIIST